MFFVSFCPALFCYVSCFSLLLQHFQSGGEALTIAAFFFVLVLFQGVVLSVEAVGTEQNPLSASSWYPTVFETHGKHFPGRLPTVFSDTYTFVSNCTLSFRVFRDVVYCPVNRYYLEMQGQPGVPLEEVSRRLSVVADVFVEECLQPKRWGLQRFSWA